MGYDNKKIEKFFEEIKKYTDNYINIQNNIISEFKGVYYKTLTELPFRIQIFNNILLNGAIDRIDVYQDGDDINLYISDYKTNAIQNEKDIERLVSKYKD